MKRPSVSSLGGTATARVPAFANAAASTRAARVDALRGAAIVWMVVYHFSFDLHFFGLALHGHNFYADALWTRQRTGIVSLFLLCAGLGQALAEAGGQGWPRFWRRWGQVAGCAALVSLATLVMFPRSWISFGVLHGMAVMLLLTRLLAPRLGVVGLLLLGAVAVALPFSFTDEKGDAVLRAEYLFLDGKAYGLRSSPA